MTEEYLQVAFEIKATCDEISRRLLRWHWEKRPGNHSLDALLKHIERRREESPAYYDHLPDLSEKTSWQQLDTTVCMRVLLDQETDAARPLDLLGDTAHPAAARRACNAVRTARNEAAHAADSTGAQRAALLFREAVESLEDGYANAALQENELARYYRRAEDFLARLSEGDAGEESALPQEPRKANAPAKSRSRAGQNAAKSGGQQAGDKRRGTGAKSGNAARAKGAAASRKKREKARSGEDKALAVILLLAVVIGLILRARSMGV